MSEPAGRVCEDPARHARKEGTPEGGAAAGYVSLPSFLSYNKKEGRPPGAEARFRGASLRAAVAGRVCKPGRGKPRPI